MKKQTGKRNGVIRLLCAIATMLWLMPTYAEGDDPLIVIEYVEGQLRQNGAKGVDSFKYAVLRQYMIEAETDKDAAYDSLSKRCLKHLYENSGTGGGVTENLDDIETALESGDLEVERLKRENEQLKRQLSELEKASKRQGIRVTTEKQKKAEEKWVTQIKKRTAEKADSATMATLKKGNAEPHLPLTFTMPGKESFTPYMSQKLRQKDDTTYLTAMARKTDVERIVGNRLAYSTTLKSPEAITYYNLQEYHPEIYVRDKNDVRLVQVEELNDITLPPLVIKQKKSKEEKWKHRGSVSISFSNNYLDSWADGGKSIASLDGEVDYKVSYIYAKKRWNGELRTSLGFLHYEKDKFHPFRINDDETRIYSTYKLRTEKVEKLFYAAHIYAKTHLFTSYDSYNDSVPATSFASPTNIFFGMGMDYTYSDNVAVMLLPATGRVFWIVGDQLDPKEYGLDHGKASIAPGAMVMANLNFRLIKGVRIDNEINCFCPYSTKHWPNDIYIDWTLDGKFVINKFFSAKLTLKMLFDKHAKSKYRERPQLQEKMTMSFGFNF